MARNILPHSPKTDATVAHRRPVFIWGPPEQVHTVKGVNALEAVEKVAFVSGKFLQFVVAVV